MANDKLHILITGETGKGRNISLDKNRMRNTVIAVILFTVLLGYGALRSIYYQQQTRQLRASTESLTHELQTTREQLNRELTSTRIELARVIREKEELTSSYQQQLASLKQDQERLLEGSISKLDEQSKVIENVIDQLGVKVKTEEDTSHSGGLFIAMDEKYQDKLICNTDRYLTALQKLPLGPPVKTKISSGFGRRKDPINSKRAFHSGIDFRGQTGDKVLATGNGVVKKSGYNKGLGHHVIISHGNGYESTFAHLSKRLVKRGEKVSRGQTIGLVGNTGRSTGSHLHYEIRRYGKAINPMKYLQVSKLTVTSSK